MNSHAVGEELFISGWGFTVGDDGLAYPSPVLLGTNVDDVTNEQCQTDYGAKENPPNTVTDDMMCAYGDVKGFCIGDAGGPLVIANGTNPEMDPTIQVGIASWGGGYNDGCIFQGFPEVYTRVSSYVDWIRSTACEEVGELCPSSSSKSSKSKSSKNDRP